MKSFHALIASRFLLSLKIRLSRIMLFSMFYTCISGMEVRLTNNEVNSGDIHSGTVEIFHAEKWRRVCSSTWDTNDADVVCRQLSFESSRPTSVAIPGNLPEMKWIPDLTCQGDETEIVLCQSSNWEGERMCTSGREAGVTCVAGTMTNTPSWQSLLRRKSFRPSL